MYCTVQLAEQQPTTDGAPEQQFEAASHRLMHGLGAINYQAAKTIRGAAEKLNYQRVCGRPGFWRGGRLPGPGRDGRIIGARVSGKGLDARSRRLSSWSTALRMKLALLSLS
jgi:hypothetical protein